MREGVILLKSQDLVTHSLVPEVFFLLSALRVEKPLVSAQSHVTEMSYLKIQPLRQSRDLISNIPHPLNMTGN